MTNALPKRTSWIHAFWTTTLSFLFLCSSIPTLAATNYEQIKAFGNPNESGSDLEASLLKLNDGYLYGVTFSGGSNSVGTVFKVSTSGTGYTILHHFGSNNDGRNPRAALVAQTDGALYGTTELGGIYGFGTIFRIQTNGSNYTVLYNFGSIAADGQMPRGVLLKAGSNSFYGTTYSGGSDGFGTVFTINKDGTGYNILHSFLSTGGDGRNPWAGVILGGDNQLYGTTANGGTGGHGTVFLMTTNGIGYGILLSFLSNGSNGQSPRAPLLQGSDGVLYGTTAFGGANSSFTGTIFKINKNGTGFSLLHAFATTDGANPNGALLEGTDGLLYGTCAFGGLGVGCVFKLTKTGSLFQILNTSDDSTNVANPNAALIEASDGTLYGTSSAGGRWRGGTVFQMKKDGTSFAIVRNFQDAGGDAKQPSGPLVITQAGYLFGVAQSGGTNGLGAVFTISTNGIGYQLIHVFGSVPGDGATPGDGLLLSPEGSLYGATTAGGSLGGGMVYRLNPDGSGYSILHSMVEPQDGAQPKALILGTNGMLYGLASSGGSYGKGTAFRLNTNGTGFEVLHHFGSSLQDGQTPLGGLMTDSSGVLYGCTYWGGLSNSGTMFKINQDGTGYMSVHNFGVALGDGTNPQGYLLHDSDGGIYGLTSAGGSINLGTIFRITQDLQNYQVFHSFSGPDGRSPNGGLLESVDGLLYGTTSFGSSAGGGNVFSTTKDGSLFFELHGFIGTNAFEPRFPQSAIIETPDGLQYGLTTSGSPYRGGTIFRLNPSHSPNLFAVLTQGGVKHVQVKGLPSRQYEILRSSDLSSWASLGTFIMPASGIYSFPDPSAPADKGYYRGVLLP